MEEEIAKALHLASSRMVADHHEEELSERLDDAPGQLATEAALHCNLKPPVLDWLIASADKDAFLLFSDCFCIDDLPSTPQAFKPVALCKSTLRARIAALVLHKLIGRETVSYQSESDGELFINLVSMPGRGLFASKSTKSMRGHTDAVSFPFPGTVDPDHPTIAPSPDFVTLVGLRNEGISTTVMPLSDALKKMPDSDVRQLAMRKFFIECQGTFTEGTTRALGDPHIVERAPILHNVGGNVWVRFSHSKVAPDPDDAKATQAHENFCHALSSASKAVLVTPGSIALINNRLALHGRSEVGPEIGGNARWLLRTYALRPSYILAQSRTEPRGHILFP